jgi:hypothetical protein
VDKLNLNDISMELMQGLNTSKTSGLTFIGVFFFACAFLGAMLNMPSFLLVSDEFPVSTPVKVVWRYSMLIIVMLPFLISDVLNNLERLLDLVMANYIPLFLLSILQFVYVYLTYFAVQRTWVAHVILLCSIPTTFLATWKIAKKARYTQIEYIGIGINVFGAYLCCCDASGIEGSNFARINSLLKLIN